MAVTSAFKAIKGAKMNIPGMMKVVEDAAKAEGEFHKKELEKSVRTWKNPPSFETLYEVTGKDAYVITGPVGNAEAVAHWTWTDEGTSPHIIRARRAPALRFRTGFQAKTVRGSFRSRRSRHFGAWRRPKAVRHPGTKARGWSEELTRRRKSGFTQRMIKAMKEAGGKAF